MVARSSPSRCLHEAATSADSPPFVISQKLHHGPLRSSSVRRRPLRPHEHRLAAALAALEPLRQEEGSASPRQAMPEDAAGGAVEEIAAASVNHSHPVGA